MYSPSTRLSQPGCRSCRESESHFPAKRCLIRAASYDRVRLKLTGFYALQVLEEACPNAVTTWWSNPRGDFPSPKTIGYLTTCIGQPHFKVWRRPRGQDICSSRLVLNLIDCATSTNDAVESSRCRKNPKKPIKLIYI